MKNAGMAGAVALVGIGLITIGLSNFANRAEAVPSAPANPGPGTTAYEPAALTEPCAITLPPEDWFSPVGLEGCLQGGGPNDYMGDLNGDGHSDRWPMLEQVEDGQSGFDFSCEAWGGTCPFVGPQVTWVELQGGVVQTYRQFVMPGVLDWHLSEAKAEGHKGDMIVSITGLADIDGDGRRDLLVTRDINGQGRSFVHLNITSGDPLVADINRDGFVNAEDLGLLIASWTG